MKTITIQCQFKDVECLCPKREIIRIYRSKSDFYEGFDLFICPSCNSLFGMDKEDFKYAHKSLNEILKDKSCPVCKNPLKELLSHPEHYVCSFFNEIKTMDANIQDIFNSVSVPVQVYDLLS